LKGLFWGRKMDIQIVLPTSPVKPINIRRDDKQKNQQNSADTEQEDKPKQENNDGIQHIDEIV